jgi:ribosomal protein S18 acetylase RimI-like enzyme
MDLAGEDTAMLANGARNLEGPEIGSLNPSEVDETLDVLARGMRDNPLHVAAFGDDPGRRYLKFRRLMAAAFSTRDLSHTLAARDTDGRIVGVCGMMPPGGCRPAPDDAARAVPALLRNGPRSAFRTARWLGLWSRHDPDAVHWHLGPVAVDAHLQGMGVGSKLMRVFGAKMDAAGDDAYLETDKPENAAFYERFGFEVVGEEKVIGVPNWFMLRHAR